MANILNRHSTSHSCFGGALNGKDLSTVSNRQHRALAEDAPQRPQLVAFLRDVLKKHHADDEQRERLARLNKALARQGFPPRLLYPQNPSTRKGNLTEVVLAEYLVVTEGAGLPLYRLRYNPNIDQSMKGDDVLAFDLDASPVRIIVGEAKFRGTPRREHVEEIVESLVRSYSAKIPVSLQFIADQLYREGDAKTARKIEACQIAIARGEIQLDYVGLLLGNSAAENCVQVNTPKGKPRRLAMISISVDDPQALVDDCFDKLA